MVKIFWWLAREGSFSKYEVSLDGLLQSAVQFYAPGRDLHRCFPLWCWIWTRHYSAMPYVSRLFHILYHGFQNNNCQHPLQHKVKSYTHWGCVRCYCLWGCLTSGKARNHHHLEKRACLGYPLLFQFHIVPATHSKIRLQPAGLILRHWSFISLRHTWSIPV